MPPTRSTLSAAEPLYAEFGSATVRIPSLRVVFPFNAIPCGVAGKEIVVSPLIVSLERSTGPLKERSEVISIGLNGADSTGLPLGYLKRTSFSSPFVITGSGAAISIEPCQVRRPCLGSVDSTLISTFVGCRAILSDAGPSEVPCRARSLVLTLNWVRLSSPSGVTSR